MMAPPYRWFDEFVNRGWPRVLPRSTLALVLAVARFVNSRTLRAYPAPARLREMAGLLRPSFFRAQRDMQMCGLAKVKTESGKRVLILTSPPPYPLERSLTRQTRQSHGRDSTVSPMRPQNRQSVRQSGHSARPGQQIKTQLRKEFHIILSRRFGVLEDDAVGEVGAAAVAVAASPERLADEAHRLSRVLQASGVLVAEVQVRVALAELAAVLHPAVPARNPAPAARGDLEITLLDRARASGRGAFIWRVGEARAWKPYPYAPGKSIGAGKRTWLTFIRNNADMELIVAAEAMLRESGPEETP